MNEFYKSLVIKFVIIALTALGGYLHQSYGATDISALATDLVNAGFTAYTMYRVTNMKLVPHASVAVQEIKGAPALKPMIGAVGNHLDIAGQTAKVVGALFFAFIIMSMAWTQPLFAQVRKPLPDPLQLFTPKSNSQPALATLDSQLNSVGAKFQALEKDIADKVINDLNAAITDATNHNDAISLPCWQANLKLAQALPAEWQTPPTLPLGIALAIQIQRDILSAITSNDAGSLKVACAALWGDQLSQIGQLGLMFGFAL